MYYFSQNLTEADMQAARAALRARIEFIQARGDEPEARRFLNLVNGMTWQNQVRAFEYENQRRANGWTGYALAAGLVGFGKNNTTLRVRILRETDSIDQVVVITADLRDAGTSLILSRAQLTPCE